MSEDSCFITFIDQLEKTDRGQKANNTGVQTVTNVLHICTDDRNAKRKNCGIFKQFIREMHRKSQLPRKDTKGTCDCETQSGRLV